MRPPTIILPMVGEGSRLKEKYDRPKPFIEIDGVTLLELSLQGLPRDWEIVFVIKEEHLDMLGALIESSPVLKGRECSIVVFIGKSSGQAETALFGMTYISPDAPIVVSNCDTYFSNDFVVDSYYDGLIGTFKSDSSAYSYVEMKDGLAIRTAEKEVISNRASSGVYYFSSVKTYLDAYLSTRWEGERYIAPMYNSMIEEGLLVGEVKQKFAIPLGTPEEIDYALKHGRSKVGRAVALINRQRKRSRARNETSRA